LILVSSHHPLSHNPAATNESITVSHDVDHIQPLIKSDLQAFYRSYFHPSSETRAKASVHLIAQGSAAASNDNVKKLTSALSQALTQLGGSTVDEAALSSRLSKLDLNASTDVQGILGAVTGYLRESAGMAEEQVKSLAEQGEELLKQILPSLNLTAAAAPPSEKEGGTKEAVGAVVEGDEKEKKKTVLIEDVRAWKASLPASQGPRMVRDLTEFEDFEAKL
jgi:insulysin